MKQFSLNVASREGIGRGSSRQIRRSGGIPAVLYGQMNEPQSLRLDGREFGKLLKLIAGSSAIVEIKAAADDSRLSVIKEIQRDPRTDQVLHVDLHEVSADQEMETEVAVHVTGDCVGVRLDNGILEIVSHELAVRCLPKDLPSFIEVDVTDLHVGGSIHVRELTPIPGVKFMDEPDQSVVACVEPAAEEEAPVVAAAPVEGAEAAAGAAGAVAAPAGDAAKPEATK
jgi:large subunit ribosomal protein L25